jgi:hypothetical protein
MASFRISNEAGIHYNFGNESYESCEKCPKYDTCTLLETEYCNLLRRPASPQVPAFIFGPQVIRFRIITSDNTRDDDDDDFENGWPGWL